MQELDDDNDDDGVAMVWNKGWSSVLYNFKSKFLFT